MEFHLEAAKNAHRGPRNTAGVVGMEAADMAEGGTEVGMAEGGMEVEGGVVAEGGVVGDGEEASGDCGVVQLSSQCRSPMVQITSIMVNPMRGRTRPA